jgi:hypothetical protein
VEAKANGFKCTDAEAIISDITHEIYDDSGKRLPTEIETRLLAELDPLEWATIMGIDPMDPAAAEADDEMDDKLVEESLDETSIVVGSRKSGKVRARQP